MAKKFIKELTLIRDDCAGCGRCGLGGKCGNVFSSMTPSDIFIIAQNPGATEAIEGKPLVGISGTILNSMLETVGLKRETFYLTNTVKCLTEANRSPNATELSACRCWLDMEIGLLQPKLIVTLGNFALRQITGMVGISRYHGKLIKSLDGRDVFPLYHPSPLVTNTKEYRDYVLNDLKELKKLI